MSWAWKSDLRFGDDEEKSWTAYTKKENNKIEEAYNKKKKTVKITGDKYVIDFKNMIQYRSDDDQLQRAVRRVEEESDSDSEEKIKGPKAKRHKPMTIKSKFFARCGTFGSNSDISSVIESFGAHTSSTLTKSVDYLICCAEDFDEHATKVVQARKFRIPIMFLPKSFKKGKGSKDEFRDAMKPENMKFEE